MCIFIHEQSGLNVIVTQRGIESTQQLLTVHRLDSLFDGIVCIEQDYPRKLNSNIIKTALDLHTMKPGETLLVGNRKQDIEAGQAAGVRTCLFGRSELSLHADFRIVNYRQLLSLLLEETLKS